MLTPDFIRQELLQSMRDNVPVILILENGAKIVGKVLPECSPSAWTHGEVVLYQRSTRKIIDMDAIRAMDITLP